MPLSPLLFVAYANQDSIEQQQQQLQQLPSLTNLINVDLNAIQPTTSRLRIADVLSENNNDVLDGKRNPANEYKMTDIKNGTVHTISVTEAQRDLGIITNDMK